MYNCQLVRWPADWRGAIRRLREPLRKLIKRHAKTPNVSANGDWSENVSRIECLILEEFSMQGGIPHRPLMSL